jgi:hypothetical protein
MRGFRRVFLALGAVTSLAGCAQVNWQATFDDWARSVCREDGAECEGLR